jgi:hypothetical protein
LNQQVGEYGHLAEPQAQAFSVLYLREREHLMRAAKCAIDAGVAQREVQLAERQGQLIAFAMLRVIDELQLSPAQNQRARRIAGEHLRALSVGDSQDNASVCELDSDEEDSL